MLGWVLRWDRQRRIEPVALQTGEAVRLLAGMSEEKRMASWHLVDPTGRVESAGLAIAPLLRLLPGGAAFAAIAGRMPGVMGRLYDWTAARRPSFGRLVSDGAKARADALIAQRVGRDRAGV